MSKPKISEEEYKQAANDYKGWCTHCNSFTRDETEPDAEGYDCPECDSPDTVIGAEDALVMGFFAIS